jgi:hypothetical protein
MYLFFFHVRRLVQKILREKFLHVYLYLNYFPKFVLDYATRTYLSAHIIRLELVQIFIFTILNNNE